jgi:hypothetical protein
MRSKLIAVPAALLVTLAISTGPARADEATDAEVEDVSECTETVEVEVVDEGDTLVAAAEEAAAAAEDLETGDECVTGRERAIESLSAAVERLSEEDAGGNGVAALVLQALIDGDSPSTIGTDHAAEMAAAAAEHRAEHQPSDVGQPDTPGQPSDVGQPDTPGQPDSPGKP